MDPNSPEAKDLISLLVSHHVAITSTLPVFEGDLRRRASAAAAAGAGRNEPAGARRFLPARGSRAGVGAGADN